jgi:hypothetical protein
MKMMKQLILSALALSVFLSDASWGHELESGMALRENLKGYREVTNNGFCSPEVAEAFELTVADCQQRLEEASDHCEEFLTKDKDNLVSDTQLQDVMGYFTHCKVLTLVGCQYSFELSERIQRLASLPEEQAKQEVQQEAAYWNSVCPDQLSWERLTSQLSPTR